MPCTYISLFVVFSHVRPKYVYPFRYNTKTKHLAQLICICTRCEPRLLRFITGNVPVAEDKYLKEYDPETPIYRGWKAYRQAPRAVSTGGGGEETSLERAMRLRHELLGVLQDCSGTTATATTGTTSGTSHFAEEHQVRSYRQLATCHDCCVLVRESFASKAFLKFVVRFPWSSPCCRLWERILDCSAIEDDH